MIIDKKKIAKLLMLFSICAIVGEMTFKNFYDSQLLSSRNSEIFASNVISSSVVLAGFFASKHTHILGSSLFITATTVLGLKHIIDKPRPDRSNNNSFPSGHTALITIVAMFFSVCLQKHYMWPSVLLVAVQRIITKRHDIIDVSAGFIIAIIVFYMCFYGYSYWSSGEQ